MQREIRKTDEELIRLAQEEDKSATDELCVRYLWLVRRHARRFFLLGGETEDLIQEGMLGLYVAVREYKRDCHSSFKNFASLCILRRIIDAVKKAASKKNLPLNSYASLEEWDLGVEFNPEAALIAQDEKVELNQKMSLVLSDFEFKVMTMYIDGMTTAEICEATGKSMKSVDNAVQRSKKKLQEIL